MSNAGDALQQIVVDHSKTMSQVSVKAVGSQLVLMTVISVRRSLTAFELANCQVGTLLAFSFFRPREKKVYAPKVRYTKRKIVSRY
jgi:hypothetical protein